MAGAAGRGVGAPRGLPPGGPLHLGAFFPPCRTAAALPLCAGLQLPRRGSQALENCSANAEKGLDAEMNAEKPARLQPVSGPCPPPTGRWHPTAPCEAQRLRYFPAPSPQAPKAPLLDFGSPGGEFLLLHRTSSIAASDQFYCCIGPVLLLHRTSFIAGSDQFYCCIGPVSLLHRTSFIAGSDQFHCCIGPVSLLDRTSSIAASDQFHCCMMQPASDQFYCCEDFFSIFPRRAKEKETPTANVELFLALSRDVGSCVTEVE